MYGSNAGLVDVRNIWDWISYYQDKCARSRTGSARVGNKNLWIDSKGDELIVRSYSTDCFSVNTQTGVLTSLIEQLYSVTTAGHLNRVFGGVGWAGISRGEGQLSNYAAVVGNQYPLQVGLKVNLATEEVIEIPGAVFKTSPNKESTKVAGRLNRRLHKRLRALEAVEAITLELVQAERRKNPYRSPETLYEQLVGMEEDNPGFELSTADILGLLAPRSVIAGKNQLSSLYAYWKATSAEVDRTDITREVYGPAASADCKWPEEALR